MADGSPSLMDKGNMAILKPGRNVLSPSDSKYLLQPKAGGSAKRISCTAAHFLTKIAYGT